MTMTTTTTTPTTTTPTPSRPPRGPLFELTWARIIEFYRDPGALFWVFGMPLLLAIALGLAFRNKPPDAVKIVVVEGADALKAAPGFDVKTAPVDEARLMLKRGQVDVLVDDAGGSVTYRYDET